MGFVGATRCGVEREGVLGRGHCAERVTGLGTGSGVTGLGAGS